MAEKFASVDDYVATFPPKVQAVLEQIRATAHRTVPDGVEAISYDIPTIRLHGRSVVHFAAWKHHISVYPRPEADDDLGRDLAPHVAGRGTLKFPLDEPFPHELFERIVAALLEQRHASAE